MYIRDVHAEPDVQALRQLIRENPLGLLTTAIETEEHPLLQASHIPFILDVDDDSPTAGDGRLLGHLARQNPHSKAMIEELSPRKTGDNVLEQDVLVIFTAQHHYVTPKFYTETKPATGKVVPTWNYSAVQAYGRAKIYYDSGASATSDFLDGQIAALTHHAETGVMGYTGGERPTEWKVKDAPERYIELLKKAIIGIEIKITRLEGKAKMSQEMGKGDREGVAEGFHGLGTDVAHQIGDIVKERSDAKAAKGK